MNFDGRLLCDTSNLRPIHDDSKKRWRLLFLLIDKRQKLKVIPQRRF